MALLHRTNNFSDITVLEIGRFANLPHCVLIEEERLNYSVAVFEWKSDGFVGLKPISVSVINRNSNTDSFPTILGIANNYYDSVYNGIFDAVSSIAASLFIAGCLFITVCLFCIIRYHCPSKVANNNGELLWFLHHADDLCADVNYSEPGQALETIAMESNQAYTFPANF